MGPLFFNVAIHQAISNMPPELACNTWYMDDGTLVGPASVVNLALSQLIPSLENISLRVNLNKTQVWGRAFCVLTRDGPT